MLKADGPVPSAMRITSTPRHRSGMPVPHCSSDPRSASPARTSLRKRARIHRNPTRPHRTETESGEKKSTRRRRRRSRGGQQGAQDSSNRPSAARGGSSSRSKNGHAGQKGEGHAPAHRRSRNRNHNVSEESRAKHTELAKKSDGTLAKADGQKQQQKPEKKQGGNKNNRKSRPPRKSGSGNRPKGSSGRAGRCAGRQTGRYGQRRQRFVASPFAPPYPQDRRNGRCRIRENC